MSTKQDTGKKRMIEALKSTLGIVTAAAAKTGISRNTHYTWLQEDAEYKAEVDGIADMAIDFAESSLQRQIQDGNTTATIFYLKTKGKDRGYVERQEVTGINGGGITIQIVDTSGE
jgi:hypothetical protein